MEEIDLSVFNRILEYRSYGVTSTELEQMLKASGHLKVIKHKEYEYDLVTSQGKAFIEAWNILKPSDQPKIEIRKDRI